MKTTVKDFAPDLTNKINLANLSEIVFSTIQSSFSGVYVPLDESFVEGLKDRADKWQNANPLNANYQKLTNEAKELFFEAFCLELNRLISKPSKPLLNK